MLSLEKDDTLKRRDDDGGGEADDDGTSKGVVNMHKAMHMNVDQSEREWHHAVLLPAEEQWVWSLLPACAARPAPKVPSHALL
jgi:hypothetical protein